MSLDHTLMTLPTWMGMHNARNMIEGKINNVLCRTKSANFLSFPAGHLREILTLKIDPKEIFRSLYALDFDQDALDFVTKEWGALV